MARPVVALTMAIRDDMKRLYPQKNELQGVKSEGR